MLLLLGFQMFLSVVSGNILLNFKILDELEAFGVEPWVHIVVKDLDFEVVCVKANVCETSENILTNICQVTFSNISSNHFSMSKLLVLLLFSQPLRQRP